MRDNMYAEAWFELRDTLIFMRDKDDKLDYMERYRVDLILSIMAALISKN